jgi:hypothetical protein
LSASTHPANYGKFQQATRAYPLTFQL